MRGLGSLIVRARRIPKLDSRGVGKIRFFFAAASSSLFGGEEVASCSVSSRTCSDSYLRSWKWKIILDTHIFKNYIARNLGIKKRYVGEEPFSPTTN
ncbi:MAG: hypothetical protein Q8835_03360, partial [Sweet potato little leaf phytoplasma]|nr:hypothetical protein [Sweet potato little leaf phytoplasma]